MHPKCSETVAEAIGDLVVEKREKPIAPVDECDVNTESFENGSVFAADDAATNHREALRNALHLEEGVRVKSVNIVESNF